MAAWHERFRKAEAHQGEALRLRRVAAQAILPTLVAHLVDTYGVTRVVLVGSLAGSDSGLRSDIDLAVEGLPGEASFRAGAELERPAHPIPVDRIPLESASPAFIDALGRDSRLLYGQPACS